MTLISKLVKIIVVSHVDHTYAKLSEIGLSTWVPSEWLSSLISRLGMVSKWQIRKLVEVKKGCFHIMGASNYIYVHGFKFWFEMQKLQEIKVKILFFFL